MDVSKTNKYLTLFLASVLAVSCSTFAGCAPGAGPEEEAAAEVKPIKWAMQVTMPIGTPHYEAQQGLCENVMVASGGRLVITPHAAGEIVPAFETLKGTHEGALDAAITAGPMDMGQLGPVAMLVSYAAMPGGPTVEEYLAWFYVGDGMKYCKQVYEKDWDIVVVGQLLAEPAEIFCHSDVKLESLADFDGVKFRTMGFWNELLERFGASVVSLPGGEIYEAAQRGVIDAFEYCGPYANWPMGFHEAARYLGVPGIHAPGATDILIVNEDSWNELPEDLKAIVSIAAQAQTLQTWMNVAYNDGIALQKYRDYGTEFFTLTDEAQIEITEAAKVLYDEYSAEDPLFGEIWGNMVEFLKVYRQAKTTLQPDYSVVDRY